MEYAELLCRADKETPSRRDVIRTIREAIGPGALDSGYQVEEPWRKSLRALRMAAEGADKKSQRGRRYLPKAASSICFVLPGPGHWRRSVRWSKNSTPRGPGPRAGQLPCSGWSSGEKLEGLTEADQPLRATIRRVDYYYGNHQYEFQSQAGPARPGGPPPAVSRRLAVNTGGGHEG